MNENENESLHEKWMQLNLMNLDSLKKLKILWQVIVP